MCTVVKLAERDIETMGELAEYLGSKEFVFYRDEKYIEDECCLCPVNLPETLKKFGISSERDDFMFDYCVPNVSAVWPESTGIKAS
jgi:hypothetical protein